ncbi:hypothetical protein ACJIZ3_001489 [Penstemon smallii]|uniref:F-box domain-containing protein n=1 Tax=Penstemon smallii TaxID=265156 RepID=A0ABD3U3R8_9LAMI
MEIGNYSASTRTQKRKFDECFTFPLNELNQDVLERVLSCLPTSSFTRLSSVCKKWKSISDSTTFKLACSQVPFRDPWFFMVDSQSHIGNQLPIIFDSLENNYKKLNPLPLNSCSNFTPSPVSSSGGLLCFFNSPTNQFTVTNPITGSCRKIIASLDQIEEHPIAAIAMVAKHESFKIVVVSGELPNLKFKQYNSKTDKWEEKEEEETTLARKVKFEANYDSSAQYFLSKCGNILSTDIQRSPCKQYSSVLVTEKSGDEVLYFLSSSGTVVSCNLTSKFYFEYPRLLPVISEYSIDLVECGGEMYVVLLSEMLESASVRVWKWDEQWKQVAVMPYWMSHKFYGKNVDINCTGIGEKILVCLNSEEICSYVMCSLVRNEWVELPECRVNGEVKEFVCAFSFEPRIEAFHFL